MWNIKVLILIEHLQPLPFSIISLRIYHRNYPVEVGTIYHLVTVAFYNLTRTRHIDNPPYPASPILSIRHSMALQRYRAAREQSRLEAKAQALEFFLSSIRDPHNPRHCATCLDGAFRECSDARQWHPYMRSRGMMKMFQDSQTYNPQLWNAVLKFLFIKRTNKQIRRLLTSLSECNCRMDEQVRRYHEMSIRRDKDSDWRTYIEFFESESEDGQRFVEVWRAFLSNLFLNLSVPIVRGGSRTTSKGSSSFWPHSPMDLIPYGAETLVDSMLRWHQFFSDPLLIHLMGCMVVVCRELVYPSLVKYRFTARVVASSKKFMDRSIAAYLTRSPLPYSLSNPRPPEHEYLRHVLIWQITDIVHYLDACFEEEVFQDCEIKVVQLCCLMLYLFPPLRDYYGLAKGAFHVDTLAKIGQELFCRFNMYGTAPPSFLVHPVIALVDWNYTLSPEESASVPQDTRLVQTLRVCYKDMRCFARGCMNSLQTSGKDFQRCGKCSIATYCGQECQAASWRDEEHPHKRVCPIIVDLLEKAGDPHPEDYGEMA